MRAAGLTDRVIDVTLALLFGSTLEAALAMSVGLLLVDCGAVDGAGGGEGGWVGLCVPL